MLKRELKINLRSFLTWTTILIVIFLIVFLVYPYIISSDNMAMMDELMKMFPEEILKAFNLDIASINSAFGWLKTEGFVLLLIITGIYSAIMGSNIVLKEENDKTIEYLNSLPIKRNSIVLNKILCGFIYIFSMVFIIAIFNYIGLSLSGEFDKKLYLLSSITPLFSSCVIFSICVFISTFTNKSRKMLGLSLGIVFISYFLLIVSELSEKVEFLKYFSVFTLADIRNVIKSVAINPLMIILAVGLTIMFVISTLYSYSKKDMV